MNVKDTSSKGEEKSVDIQDAFDSLLLCEDSFVRQGYEEGLADGEKAGFQEGFDIGIQKGTQIGAEIAFYRGFAKGWLPQLSSDCKHLVGDHLKQQVESCKNSIQPDTVTRLLFLCQNTAFTERQSDPKAIKALQKLLALAESFPEENPKDQDVLDLLNSIRAKFKHCCSILKVETSYSASAAAQLSF